MPFSRGFARRGLAGSGFAVLLLLGGVRATESGPSGAAAVPPGPAHLVHDFFPGEFDDEKPLPQLTRLGNMLFFLASDRDTGTTVWRTDGTPAGTRRVPIAPSAGVRSTYGIVGVVGERMLLLGTAADDPATSVLLAAGETGEAVALGPYQIRADDPLAPTTILAGRFYYRDCGEPRCEVWSTDGTPAGTGPVATLATQFPDADLFLTAAFADRWLVFSAGHALYAYDVAADRVLTLRTGPTAAYPVGSSLFLIGKNGLSVSTLAAPRALLLFSAHGLASAGWTDSSFFFVQPDGIVGSSDGKSVKTYAGTYLEAFSLASERLGKVGGTTLLPMPGYYFQSLFGVDEAKGEISELLRVCNGKYGCLGSTMSPVTVAGGRGFEAISNELWVSDGTVQGTRHHRSLTRPDADSFTALDGRLVLGAASWRGAQNLWATDGTKAGTVALADGGVGRPFTVQGPAVAFGEALITAADRTPTGQQLWRIEGGRTAPLTDLRHAATGIQPYYALPFGGDRLVLAGSLGWTGVTPEGVTDTLRPEIDFCSADGNPCLDVPVAVGGRLVFQEVGTARLKSTDGTLAGRRNLPLEDADGVVSLVASLGTFRDRAMVLGSSGGLWTSDGTPAGTRFVTRLPPEPVSGSPGLPVVAPFSAGAVSYLFRRLPDPGDDTLSALELWRTDGTAAGTLRLASIPFDKESAPYPAPALVGGKLFFRVLGVLWVSDGTAAGTRTLADQPPGGTFALAAGETKLYAGAGYLDIDQPGAVESLWTIDPATLAATKIATFPFVGPGAPGTSLGDLLGDTLFFQVTNPGGVARWWRSEGTLQSTVRLPDFLATNVQQDFVTAGDRRYFTACEGAHGCELWSTDRLGEDTRLIEDLFPGTRSSDPQILAVAGHTLWFAGTEPDVGRELWILDLPAGTAGTTTAAWTRSPATRAKRSREPQWKRRLR
jgi:ELWxxDGT repeat protein